MNKRFKRSYVYIHYFDGVPVYVGMGKEHRVLSFRDRAEYEWNEWRVIADDLSREDARELEQLVIDTIGYDNLNNLKTREKSKIGRSREEKIAAYERSKLKRKN